MAEIVDRKNWDRGYVQVYTGGGKGKTTAAVGLAVRAAGAGIKVFFAQFLKGRPTSEFSSLERLSEWITVEQYGRGDFIRAKPEPEDIAAAKRGLEAVRAAFASGEYGLVVLDEANVAVHLGVLQPEELLDLVKSKPPGTELVLTGREAHRKLIECADLVTEMVEVKHYYSTGVKARAGIEF